MGTPRGRKAFWPKMTARLAFKGKSETVGVAVADRKTTDSEFAGFV
jgi:hypothetical protein